MIHKKFQALFSRFRLGVYIEFAYFFMNINPAISRVFHLQKFWQVIPLGYLILHWVLRDLNNLTLRPFQLQQPEKALNVVIFYI